MYLQTTHISHRRQLQRRLGLSASCGASPDRSRVVRGTDRRTQATRRTRRMQPTGVSIAYTGVLQRGPVAQCELMHMGTDTPTFGPALQR